MQSNDKAILSFANHCSNDIGNAQQQSSRIDLDMKTEDGETPLISACKNGSTEALRFLLQHSNEIDLNAMSSVSLKDHDLNWRPNILKDFLDWLPDIVKCTSFHQACMNGHVEIVRLLLEYSKDIDFNA